jgi:hypothetical protein
MLIITPKELIETLKKYNPDEQLLVTWWSQEDVEWLMADQEIEDAEKAKEIWESVNAELDSNTSDYAISHINDELATLVFAELEK